MENQKILKNYTFMLIDLDYVFENNEDFPTIRLYGKTPIENVLVTLKDFRPYFFITKKLGIDHLIKTNDIISNWFVEKQETKMKRYFGGEEINVIKIIGNHPENTPKIRQQFENEGYDIHEADIPFMKRFLIDLQIHCLNLIVIKEGFLRKQGDNTYISTSSKNITSAKLEELKSADFFYKLKIMAFDIEVLHKNETIQQLLSEVNQRISAISFVLGTNASEIEKEVYILEGNSDSEEKRLLMKFLDKLYSLQPDVLITFNGDNFDLPYLLERMKKLNLPSELLSQFKKEKVFYSNRNRTYRIKGRISYDISYKTWGIHPISGKKGLGDIAETLLGIGKIEISESIGELWEKGVLLKKEEDKLLLIDYSLRDSVLTYKLFWKLGIVGWLEVVRLTGYPAGDSPGSTERLQGEFELMRFCNMKNVLIPSAPNIEEVNRRTIERRKNPHVGGTVLAPKGTLHVGVLITDFRSMYPSVCVAHNIGGEVLKEYSEIENVNPLEIFKQSPQSCLSLMEETLIKRREISKEKIKKINLALEKNLNEKNKQQLLEEKEILDKEQYSLKIVANSMYGAHNYIKSRFYSITLGNAITNIARTYILQMEKHLEVVSKRVIPVDIIYGDTDSAFIKILDPSLIIEIYNEKHQEKREKKLKKLKKLISQILRELNQNFPTAMELTFEDLAFKLIFKPGRAKAYSYLSLLKNRLQITGFEAIRSDWSPLAREAQKRVLEYILKEPLSFAEHSTQDPGLEKARSYLINLGIKIFEMSKEDLLEKVTVLSPIKRNPKSYKTKVPVVQAFLHYTKVERLDPNHLWKEFDKFPWVVVPGKGMISNRSRHPKYVDDVDREYYITEILRSSEGFGLRISLEEIKTKYSIIPIDLILKSISESSPGVENGKTDNNSIQKKSSIIKQTKINHFFNHRNNDY